MDATIRKIISELDENELINKYFYLCHVNYLYCNDTVCIPCEIALIEFSLFAGITKERHFIVHGPVTLPIGSRYDVEERIANYHGIPIKHCISYPINHHEIFKEIVKFLNPGNMDHIPPIYTMANNTMNFCMSAVKSSLALFCKGENVSPNIFEVYSLTSLFNEIINAANVKMGLPKNTYLALAEREINKDRFLTYANIACDFHVMKDLVYKCSLSVVTRWAYTIIANYSNITGIEINFGNDNKWRNDWNVLQSSPNRPIFDCSIEKTVNKEPIIPTLIFHGRSKINREEQPEKNNENTPQHSQTLDADISTEYHSNEDEFPDIGAMSINKK